MGTESKIEWTDATWNPWQGCTKVSPACTNCYMFTDMKRYGKDGAVVHRSAPPTFNLPLRRKRGGEYKIAPGSKVFTCSWSDWFHEKADEWRDEAWAIIRQRPDLTFQIVTKRTERILDCLPSDWGNGYDNVWLIATTENQQRLEERVEHLLRVPAVVHGLSIEPLLGPMDVTPYLGGATYRCKCGFHRTESELIFSGGSNYRCADCGSRCEVLSGINWVIVGGETKRGARPMHPDWVRSIRDQCQAAGVPFFFKQWGEHAPIDQLPEEIHDGYQHHMTSMMRDTDIVRPGKKAAGRLLDGREWSQFPVAVTAP